MNIERYYFSMDGSYGLWQEGSVLTDVSQWTMADWVEIENCTDHERAFVARGIVNKYTRLGAGL